MCMKRVRKAQSYDLYTYMNVYTKYRIGRSYTLHINMYVLRIKGVCIELSIHISRHKLNL